MAGYVSLWLEAHGHARVQRTLDFGTRCWLRYLYYGLALAGALQVLHAGFMVVLPRH